MILFDNVIAIFHLADHDIGVVCLVISPDGGGIGLTAIDRDRLGHPVAVNPDRELRREADKRGWQVRDFRRPVRLRQRLPQVRAPSPGAVALGASAVVAAVVGWLYFRRLSAQRRDA